MDINATFPTITAHVPEVDGAITFTIDSQSPGTNFMIHATTGVLDSDPADKTFNVAETYTLVLKAVEDANPTNYGTENVTVTVKNMPPVFFPTTYLKNFTESQAVAAVVTTVTATDPGVAPTAAIIYTLMKIGTYTWDPNTQLMVESDGNIKVKTGQILEFQDTSNKYQFICKATLAGDTAAKVTVFVTLEYPCPNGVAAVYSSVIPIFFCVLMLTYVV